MGASYLWVWLGGSVRHLWKISDARPWKAVCGYTFQQKPTEKDADRRYWAYRCCKRCQGMLKAPTGPLRSTE